MAFDLKTYLEDLQAMVMIDSPTSDANGVNLVANYLEPRLSLPGYGLRRVPISGYGDLLQVSSEGASDYDVLLLGHIDTVYPLGTVAAWPFSKDEQRCYGPGVADMKGAIAYLPQLLACIAKARPSLKVSALIVPDEEVGSLGSREEIARIAGRSRYTLGLEPARADGGVVRARGGSAVYKLHLQGKPAHAGVAPWEGASAIVALAKWVEALHALNDYENWLCVNVGTVSGGTTRNVVPEYAEAVIDIRHQTPELLDEVKAKFKAWIASPLHEGVNARIETISEKPCMPETRASAALCDLAEQCARDLNISNFGFTFAGGTSDANYAAAAGSIVMDGLGPVGGHYHSEQEYIELSSIAERFELLRAILSRLPI